MATAKPAASMDIDGEAREVVRKFKRAERAHREAAKSAAQFIERIESLGIKFQIADQKGVIANHGRDQRNAEEEE